MREIEVKARIENIDKVVEKLKDLGCVFEDEVEQIDTIFLEKSLTYKDVALGIPVARIRSSHGKHIFTVKMPVKNLLDKLECETEVKDPEAMTEALKLMSFNPVMTINKKRVKTKFQADEICVDKVESLGNFIEMERLAQDTEDPLKIQDSLFSFLESIGVKKSKRVTEGYDILIYKAGLK